MRQEQQLAIDARYSPEDGFRIEGTSKALAALADALAGKFGARLDFDPGARLSQSPEPYEEFIEGLVVIPGGGPVRIERKQGTIEVFGAPDKLRILSENVRGLALEENAGDSHHIHIEYHPDHFFLDQGAEPVVVVLADGAPSESHLPSNERKLVECKPTRKLMIMRDAASGRGQIRPK